MLWLLRQGHLHIREGDNNPTVGLGLIAPTDTDDTNPFEPVSYIPIIKPYVIWKKDLTCMEKKLVHGNGDVIKIDKNIVPLEEYFWKKHAEFEKEKN